MSTTVDLDEARLLRLMAATGAATGEEAVRKAVDDYLRLQAGLAGMLELEGQVQFDLDWREMERIEISADGTDDRPGAR